MKTIKKETIEKKSVDFPTIRSIKPEHYHNIAEQELWSLFIDGTLVRRENFAPYEWNAAGQDDTALQNLAAGNYTLRAVAIDNEGAIAETTITITVLPNTPQGTFFLQNVATGDMLDADPDGVIGLYGPGTSDDKKWNFLPTTDGFVMLDNGLPDRGPIRASTTPGNLLVWIAESNNANPYVNREWLPIHVSGNIYKFQCRDAARGYIAASGGDPINQLDGDATTAHWELISTSSARFSASDLNEEITAVSLEIYPNPLGGDKSFTIELKGIESADISIFNINGQLLLTEKYNGKSLKINARHFPNSGIYFIKSISGDGTMLTKKLVVD